jgi:hypothetical protein
MLGLGISRTSVSGVLEGRWQLPTTDAEVRETLAHWGPADCESRQFAVDFSAPTYGAIARSMIDRLTDLVELKVTWTDGSSTTARAAFTSDAGGACVLPRDYPTATWAVTLLDGILELQTEDGRLDGSYEVTAEIYGDTTLAPAQQTIHVETETYVSDGPMTPSELGFARITTVEVPRPSMSLQLIVESGETLHPDSAITLWRHELVCQPDPELCTDEFEAAEHGAFSL